MGTILNEKKFLTCNKYATKKVEDIKWHLMSASKLITPSDLANCVLLHAFFYKVDKMFSSSRNSIFQAVLNLRALPEDVLLICH